MEHRKLLETYDSEAKAYDESRRIFERGRFATRERKIYDEYISEGSRILVVACGTGRHLDYLVTKAKCEVIAVDLSLEMLKIARTKCRPAALFHGVAEALPFADEAFDVIIVSRAFYLFIDKLSFLREAYRVLKVRGSILMSTISEGTFLTKFGTKIGVFEQIPENTPRRRADLESMLRSASFKDVHTRCVVLFTGDPPLPKIALRLVEAFERVSEEGRWVTVVGLKARS